MAQVLFFGASSVYGVGGEAGGAPDILKAEIHKLAYATGGLGEEAGHEIYNLGIPGATSSMLLDRHLPEISPRLKTNRKTIILLSVGSNDAHDFDDKGTHAVDIASYKQNLEALFQTFKQAEADVIVYGLTPVDEAKTAPEVSSHSGITKYFHNQRIKEFETMLIEVAKANRATAIPFFEQAIQESWARFFLYHDGLHPNSAGHRWIADKIRPSLWNLLNIN